MTLHKEGFGTLFVAAATLMALNVALHTWANHTVFLLGAIASVVVYLILVQFFRSPHQPIPVKDDAVLYSPADGKVVAIEEIEETEYFKDKRLQISIFLSVFNVHINRNGMGGLVKYFRYHPGKYLVAWHPKSSTENERTTIVVENKYATVLFKQIAGLLARRIVTYFKQGETIHQGTEMGFMKFGSRIDILLPIDTDVKVVLNQAVRGNETIIATFKAKE